MRSAGELDAARDPIGPFRASPFEHVVRRHRRPSYSVEPMSIAWDAVAFRLSGVRNGVACIPRAALAEFLDDLDAGRLDEQIVDFLASPPRGRVLRASDQARTPGLFDELGSPGAIVPPERVPGRGLLGGTGGGTPADSRRDKSRRPRGPRRARLTVAVVAAVVVVVGIALATRGGGRDKASVAVGSGPNGTPTSAGGGSTSPGGGGSDVFVTYETTNVTHAIRSSGSTDFVLLRCRAASGCVFTPPSSEAGESPDVPLVGGRFHYVQQSQTAVCITPGAAPDTFEVFTDTWDLQTVGSTQVGGVDIPARLVGTHRSEITFQGEPGCGEGALLEFTFDAPAEPS